MSDQIRLLLADLAQRPQRPRPANPYWMRGLDFYGAEAAITVLNRLVARFKTAHGYAPDLLKPETFSECLILEKFFAYWPLPSVADKLYAHEFARRLCGEDVVPNIVWHGKSFLDFYDADVPPGDYMLKANHGSKMGRRLSIPHDTDVAWEEITRETSEWLGTEFGRRDGEWQYCVFQKYLFLEQFLEDKTVSHPYDYKFYCRHGRCQLIHVDVDRYGDFKCSFYHPDWRPADIRLVGFGAADVPRPANLGRMIEIVERLSADLPFARVDLYNLGGRDIKFGEITLVPGNGMERFENRDMDRCMAQMLFGESPPR